MRYKSILTWLPIAVTVTAFGAAPAHATGPVEVGCGDHLSTDGYLAADLTCVTGITLDADVTLDLRGHRLIGTPDAVPPDNLDSDGYFGVRNGFGGRSTVRVINGKIENWSTGIVVHDLNIGATSEQTVRMSITGVNFKNNGIGVNAYGTYPDVITVNQSRFQHNGTGIYNVQGAKLTVDRTVFAKSTRAAVEVFGSRGVTITNSRMEYGTAGLLCGYDDCTVKNTKINHNETGIEQRGGLRLSLFNNAFTANATGVMMRDGATTATRNVFVNNRTGFKGDEETPGDDWAIRDVALTGNAFRGNVDGIYLVPKGHALLKDNVAVKNTRYGIYAPEATDLGGNVASGNGLQCVGVSCP